MPGMNPPSTARRGRPALMPREAVLERIRALSRRAAGLYRIHHTHVALYARARRQFGSWAAALAAAGIDYRDVLRRARSRGALRSRSARVRIARSEHSGNL
jgi:hypothetical protein